MAPTVAPFNTPGLDRSLYFPRRLPFPITKAACWPELFPPAFADDAIPRLVKVDGTRFDFPLGKFLLFLIPAEDLEECLCQTFAEYASIQMIPIDNLPERYALPLPPFDSKVTYQLCMVGGSCSSTRAPRSPRWRSVAILAGSAI